MYAEVVFYATHLGIWMDRHKYTFSTSFEELVPEELVVVHTRFGYQVAKFIQYVEEPFSDGSPMRIIERLPVTTSHYKRKKLVDNFSGGEL